LRPSAFIDIGSVFALKKPRLNNIPGFCAFTPLTNPPTPAPTLPTPVQLEPGQTCADVPADPVFGAPTYAGGGFREFFLGNSPKPRLSVGFGVNWTSPFGPLRIDIAKALLKQEGDDTKLLSFNVGTQF